MEIKNQHGTSKIALYTIIVVLFVCNILLIRSGRIKSNEIEGLRIEVSNRVGENEYLSSLFNLNLKPNPLSGDLKFIDECGKEHFISEVVKNQSILYLVSKNDCRTCFTTDLEHLKKIDEMMGSANIIIVGDMLSIRDLSAIKKSFKLNFNLFSIKDNDSFSQDVSKFKNNNKPLFLIINSDLNIKRAFYSDFAFPSLTDQFFQNIGCCMN